MKRALVAALGLFLAAGVAFAQFDAPPSPYALYRLAGPWLAGQLFNLGFNVPSTFYSAMSYGCTWDGATNHDVGPCVIAAEGAAAASHGAAGAIQVPGGIYYFATPIAIQASGIRLVGLGTGINIDNNANGPVPITELIWNGAAGAGPALLVGPTGISPSGLRSLYSVDVDGIVFNCASLLDTCVEYDQTSYSTWRGMAIDARKTNVLFTTMPSGFADAPGTQNNEIWMQSRSTSPVVNSVQYSPTGLMLDRGASSTWNVSYNHIHLLSAVYALGDGIVFGSTDNNTIDNMNVIPTATGTTGTPVVFANSTYVTKSGVAVNGAAGEGNDVKKTTSSGIVQGFQTGATITPGGGNTSSIATVTLVTSGPTTEGSPTLNFLSTTGVMPGMVANAGGWGSGIPPNDPVGPSTGITGTTVGLVSGTVLNVATGTSVVFSWGASVNAVAGSYTLTDVDNTHWSLTAPSGGHTQTDIAISGGVVTFEDMTIPISGTPTPGETYAIVLSTPVKYIHFEKVDKSNNVQNFFIENGAGAWIDTTINPLPQPTGGDGNIKLACTNGVTCAASIGGVVSNATGYGSFQGGGIAVSATGFGAAAIGGNNVTAAGTYGVARGWNTVMGGTAANVGGINANDHSRYIATCTGAGTPGQFCSLPLVGSAANSSAVTLTGDNSGTPAASPNPNCINIPDNTGFAFTAQLMAFDITNPAKSYSASWGMGSAGPHMLTRGTGASTTLIDGSTSAISPDASRSNGSLTGLATSLAANVSVGCITSLWNAPSGNTDSWNVVETVNTWEVP